VQDEADDRGITLIRTARRRKLRAASVDTASFLRQWLFGPNRLNSAFNLFSTLRPITRPRQSDLALTLMLTPRAEGGSPFPPRANEVFDLVNRYSSAATDGTLGLQGEHLVLAAFAREQYLLTGEAVRRHNTVEWTESDHNLDFIFEKNGVGYGIEVKNTLGYLDIKEFVTKVRMCIHLGLKPIFAVRALPKTWADALIAAGGYAMIMGYQFYPWTHADLAGEIREKLHLPVDTPKRIEAGTMQRFQDWVVHPKTDQPDLRIAERLLARFEAVRTGSRMK